MLTKHKALRAGVPVWAANRKPAVPHQGLAASRSTDVLVIGAGISGALVAEALTAADLRVVVVDRRGPMEGSTSASTALLQYDLDTPLSVLSRSIGVADAEMVWRRSRLALDALRDRTTWLGIDADLQRRDCLYLDGDLLDSHGLASEERARQRAGFEVAFLSSREVQERYGIDRRAGLLGFENLVADPRKLTAGYLRAAQLRGAEIFAPVDIVAVEESARQVIATTDRGHQIRARQVVFATGYELAKGIPARGHRIASTWVIATKPQRARLWPTECVIWEASKSYLYLRTTSDGRIVCGGEDEPFQDEARRDALSSRKVAVLERKLQQLFPAVDAKAAFRWTGSFGASATGTPSIGLVPGKRRTLAVLGYGGNGITFSMLAAQIVRGIVTGARDPDERLFSIRR